MQGYFESLRNELGGCGLNISMVCPGPVESGLLTRCFTEKLDMVSNEKYSMIKTERLF